MLVEVDNGWTLNQSNEFIVYILKSQNPKQKMNNVDSLSHATNFLNNGDKMGLQ